MNDTGTDDLDRAVSICGCSVAELTKHIIPHSPKAAIVFDKVSRTSVSGHLVDTGTDDLDRAISTGVCTVSKFAVHIIPHSPKATITFNEKSRRKY